MVPRAVMSSAAGKETYSERQARTGALSCCLVEGAMHLMTCVLACFISILTSDDC